jgi:phosphoserine phosphatase
LSARWSPENRAVLEELRARKFSTPPIAVFDWDNTCIRGDIADATFHALASALAFRFDAPGFWEWVNEASLATPIREAYDKFCAAPTPAHRAQLRLAFEQTRHALQSGEDDNAAWAWDTGAFIGWTPDQVRAYARQVIARELSRGREIETLRAEDGTTFEIQWGLSLHPEVRALIQELRRAGWQVWIISGSPQWLVEEFGARYGFPRARVVGMRRVIVKGRITSEVAPPCSYGDGKLDAYHQFVSAREAPTLVAGDSLGDWKLLEGAREVRLLIEPIKEKLRAFAEFRQRCGEHWLIQDLGT